jgi:hypothetical protein
VYFGSMFSLAFLHVVMVSGALRPIFHAQL